MAWRSVNAGHVSLGQLKVVSAIENCRTTALGGHVARCEDCAYTTIAYIRRHNRFKASSTSRQNGAAALPPLWIARNRANIDAVLAQAAPAWARSSNNEGMYTFALIRCGPRLCGHGRGRLFAPQYRAAAPLPLMSSSPDRGRQCLCHAPPEFPIRADACGAAGTDHGSLLLK